MEYRPEPPPPPSIPLTDTIAQEVIKRLETVHSGLSKAEMELALYGRTAPSFDAIRIGYGSTVDLIALFGLAINNRRFPERIPDTRMAGVPKWVIERELGFMKEAQGLHSNRQCRMYRG